MQPYETRRMLTEGAMWVSDKRAQFVGLDGYVGAGGEILRDLFPQDDSDWLQEAGLLDIIGREKLAEGWKWGEVDADVLRLRSYKCLVNVCLLVSRDREPVMSDHYCWLSEA